MPLSNSLCFSTQPAHGVVGMLWIGTLLISSCITIRFFKRWNILLTHSLLRLVKAIFPIELNRKQKHFQLNAIMVENYYCIANTSVTTKLHDMQVVVSFFDFITYRREPEVMRKIIPHN